VALFQYAFYPIIANSPPRLGYVEDSKSSLGCTSTNRLWKRASLF